MTKRDDTRKARRPARGERESERRSEPSTVVLYTAAGQELRATVTRRQLVLETWKREEMVVFSDAEDVLLKLSGAVAQQLDGSEGVP